MYSVSITGQSRMFQVPEVFSLSLWIHFSELWNGIVLEHKRFVKARICRHGKVGGNGTVPPPPYFFGSNFFLREYFLLKFSGWSRTRMIRPKMHSFCENRKFGGTPSPNFHPWWISKFTEKWKNWNRRVFITKSDWWPCINDGWRVARGSRLVLGILACLRMHFWPRRVPKASNLTNLKINCLLNPTKLMTGFKGGRVYF